MCGNIQTRVYVCIMYIKKDHIRLYYSKTALQALLLQNQSIFDLRGGYGVWNVLARFYSHLEAISSLEFLGS